ncbi:MULTISPECIES: hypothetical protein [unclassified Synechococcus]|jgi:apolipoprotein N-acyltransferase|uniref:hypothetical protein n=1 Tax=unclassified Synechococcus TaxID=2626047 RepID=UPI0010390EAC|nr:MULTISPECIES: hypothetical protein [unclassified Synechococcus]QNG25966.1 hypothetical protein H0O21_05910 [Synechococcus sp. HK01-R]TCD59654.1 hypothetical protein CWE17_02520 [Synechococcus sp. BS56D]
MSRRSLASSSWLNALRQPAPWIALVLLAITVFSTAPRLWFWLALLMIVLLVGWVQALKHDPADPHGD